MTTFTADLDQPPAKTSNSHYNRSGSTVVKDGGNIILPARATAREIVFVDPGVSDLEHLAGIRPDVEASAHHR